jgi:hypothetical protein
VLQILGGADYGINAPKIQDVDGKIGALLLFFFYY